MPDTALLVVDMLNPYEHEDADKLVESVRETLPQMALDAYLRGFEVDIPSDAVAHIEEEFARAALGMAEKNLHSELTRTGEVDLHG